MMHIIVSWRKRTKLMVHGCRLPPLPRITKEINRETNSGTCSKSLFSPANTSKGESVDKRRSNENEVNQINEVDQSNVWGSC